MEGYLWIYKDVLLQNGKNISKINFLIPEMGSIAGFVRDDKNNSPIQDAHVSVIDRESRLLGSDVTSFDGSYRINNIAEGTYTVSVEKEGYEKVDLPDISVASYKLTSSANSSLHKIQALGNISGLIKDKKTGRAIDGAEVFLIGSNGDVSITIPSPIAYSS